MQMAQLSSQHRREIDRSIAIAKAQWTKDLHHPSPIIQSLGRILLFLRQNGGASRQARHVASLAFVMGEQVVQHAGWRWMSVSEDGSVNPAIVSPDGRRACLVVDAVTLLLVDSSLGTVARLFQACVDGQVHSLVISFDPEIATVLAS